MEIKCVVNGVVSTNTYFIIIDNKGIVIDATDYQVVKKAEKDYNFKVEYALFTHGHFDHISAGAKLKNDGVKTYITVEDADKLYTGKHAGGYFGITVEPFTADNLLKDGDVLELLGQKIKVLLTAGHTEGSCCYILNDIIFSGDTLFRESVGRTDLGGNATELRNSLRKLIALDGDYTIYAGHGEPTTLRHEEKYNYYI